eukprot:538422-Amphidinium_carterae.1
MSWKRCTRKFNGSRSESFEGVPWLTFVLRIVRAWDCGLSSPYVMKSARNNNGVQPTCIYAIEEKSNET